MRVLRNTQKCVQKLTLIVFAGALLPACGEVLQSSKLTAASPFDGRSWSETTYIEPDPDNPTDEGDRSTDLITLGGSAVRGFEGAPVPGRDDFWVAASFADRGSGQFEGYARRYQPGSGWASAGEDFRVVASSSAFSAGAAQISIEPGGSVLSAFLEDDSSGEDDSSEPVDTMMTAYRTTSWRSGAVQALAGSNLPGLSNRSTLLDATVGLALGWPMDLLLSPTRPGIGYLFLGQMDADEAFFSGVHWSASTGFDSDPVLTSQGTTLSLNSSPSHVFIREDGTGAFCVFSEHNLEDAEGNRIPVVNAHCSDSDTLLAGVFDASEPSDLENAFTPVATAGQNASVSGEEVAASLVDAAYDGADTLLAVFYREDESGTVQLHSRGRVAGVWEDFLLPVTTSVTASYTTAQENSFPIRPAVTALSPGRFLVVWPMYELDENRLGLFYSVRDGDGIWARPKSMGIDIFWQADGLIDGAGLSVVDGLWLYSNGDGEAALAVRYLGSEHDDMASSDEIARKWIFSRFTDTSESWDDASIHGRPGYEEDKYVGCIPSEAPDGLNHCSQPPSGAVFSDGSAVIVFPMSDNELRARLGSVIYQ